MKAWTAILGLLCWPPVWLWGFGLAAITLLLDLLATPFLAWAARRARWPDDPPLERNASIIVLNHNGEAFLADLLPSLKTAVQRAPGDHEILVVDNGSTDGSTELVSRDHPDVRLVRLPENRYFIRGNRAGAEAARGDILVFVNNDMRVEPEFLLRLLERFGPGDLFAVTACIKMEGERVETGRTRACFRRGALHFVQVDGGDGRAIPSLWAGGGSSAFDRRKYESIGGFEALYEPCYVEDVSLSYQAWRRGWRVLFEPRSVVHHVHKGTVSKVFRPRTAERIDRRNRELFFWRSVTDAKMVCSHAFWLPWNVLKDASRTGLAMQLTALLCTLPRLPHAWLERERARASTRRSDRETLRLANHVGRYRRALCPSDERQHVVLSLGSTETPEPTLPGFAVVQRTIRLPPPHQRPVEDLFGLVPRPFWNAVGVGKITDAVRDAVCETDHDVVYFRDPWILAAAPSGILDGAAILQFAELPRPDSRLERWRLERFLLRLARRVRVTACASDTEATSLLRLDGTLPCHVSTPEQPEGFAELCRTVAGERS